MKKVLKIIASVFIAIFLITSIQYVIYRNNCNKIVYNVFDNVKEKYPDVDDEVLLNSLTLDNDSDGLSKYGFDKTDNFLEEGLSQNIIISLVFFLVISIILISIYFMNKKKRTGEIDDLIYYLKQINNKNYDFKIEENKEDKISILTNELYKTMVSLKEVSEQSISDKKKIKNNLADISHQIKTPLTSINIMIDNMIDYPDMDSSLRREYLSDISKQLNNINFLVINILKLSRFDANVVEFNQKEIFMKDIIDKSVENVRALINEKNVIVNVEDNKSKIIGDFNWEVEAYTNIIKNAVEHSKDSNKIDISFEDSKYFLKVFIKDQGEGIGIEELKNIFKRFYKGKDSRENSFGIGLNLAYEILKRDNAEVKVKSTKNIGTEFLIQYMK